MPKDSEEKKTEEKESSEEYDFLLDPEMHRIFMAHVAAEMQENGY